MALEATGCSTLPWGQMNSWLFLQAFEQIFVVFLVNVARRSLARFISHLYTYIYIYIYIQQTAALSFGEWMAISTWMFCPIIRDIPKWPIWCHRSSFLRRQGMERCLVAASAPRGRATTSPLETKNPGAMRTSKARSVEFVQLGSLIYIHVNVP